jgi:hypothetical protein
MVHMNSKSVLNYIGLHLKAPQYNCRHTLFSQRAFVCVALGFFFGFHKVAKICGSKKTLLEPLFSTRYQFVKQYLGTCFLCKISICETVLGALKF